jgi:hypothetical protein
MNSEWPVVAVVDVCSLIVDCVNKTAPVVPEKTPFRMIRTTNVRYGRIDLSECERLSRNAVFWLRGRGFRHWWCLDRDAFHADA